MAREVTQRQRATKLAAFELVKQLTDNAGMDPNERWRKVDLLFAFAAHARREALEEAAAVADEHTCGGEDDIICQHQNCGSVIAGMIDRLAREGVMG